MQCTAAAAAAVTVTVIWTKGTLEEYLPATTFGAPASSTAGHGRGAREVARNRGILHSHSGA